ncbi:hypothetical protein C9374_007020 [Naegleria lovaniensis]|uniref:ADP-ribosylation factor-like protein 2-binding protein n=1 Tax=Naegleria lovaniensis TaxID=51637 RepID=A0AA88KSB0_NAELO|nr:uncharacterized protein C9374_007020 [Naegleria lovaniensis]KAG2393489.1 hypothetical protein C9374_007020 [Naegleria lovaniensis]
MTELAHDDECVVSKPVDEEQLYFDTIIGALEETMMEESFSTMIDKFAEQNCNIFEEGEENKLEYTTLFAEYQGMIEKYLETSLNEKIQNFELSRFLRVLEKVEQQKKEQTTSKGQEESNDDEWEDIEEGDMSGDVFDMLLSFTDFMEFKELMLSYKKQEYFKDKFSGLLVVSNGSKK